MIVHPSLYECGIVSVKTLPFNIYFDDMFSDSTANGEDEDEDDEEEEEEEEEEEPEKKPTPVKVNLITRC